MLAAFLPQAFPLQFFVHWILKAAYFFIITCKVFLNHYRLSVQSIDPALTQFSSIFTTSEKPVFRQRSIIAGLINQGPTV